jgi:CRISPR-associated endonuclease Csn1
MGKLGLDLGSSSIGWALREGNQITKKGVITFDSGMIKGQGGYSSPAADRRKARSKRRLIQSRKYRKWELLKVLIENKHNLHVPLEEKELFGWSRYKKGQTQKFPESKNFLLWLRCDFSYLENGSKYRNPYELRVKALDYKLHPHEFGRALFHLVQRRGYKDIGEADKETEKQIERRGESGFNTAVKNHRTIAEALTNNFLKKGKRARNQYPYRDEYSLELELICKSQGYNTSKNNKDEYNDDFVSKVWKAIIWQRPLKSQKGNIGKCTLEPDKPRCPVSHPVFEIFRAWSYINTIKYRDEHGVKQSIPNELRMQLFQNLFLKKEKNFKFEEIRKFLDKLFKTKKEYNYPYNVKKEMYDSTVSGMPVCSELLKLFGDGIKEAISTIENYHMGNAPKITPGYSIYDLWHILFQFDKKISKDRKYLERFAVEKLNIPNVKTKTGEEYNPFARLKESFLTGYADLSLKALIKIIPFLKEGHLYNEAVLLAKIPELLPQNWNEKKQVIKLAIKESNSLYERHKQIIGITNNLIDQYKGMEAPVYAFKDYQYTLDENDKKDVEKACVGYFGEKTWQNRTDTEKTIAAVTNEYQSFFHDKARAYRETPTLTNIFNEHLKKNRINLTGSLYHHSNTENKYGTTVKDKKTEMEILPEARIDSIKNPMFNKSMSLLRKLVNELILQEIIDKDTEVIVEVARELNDNNKRIAIESFQRKREDNRKKYREFLQEFKAKENISINVEESLSTFELWTEQAFEETIDEKKQKVTNRNFIEVLKEKEAIKRYELWMEQKGQCIYTGKMISISQLFSNDIDIEHTIPRSLLPDNTMANQTVCYAWYNRNKKNNGLAKHCDNFSEDKQGWGTRIEDRLENWIQIRSTYKDHYEKRLKPLGNEDEAAKNKRIQEKHYYQMHYEYWHDKVERFYADEVKDRWARRQLTDTQTISKYAREFLKTYFRKVAVQKGIVTSEFRKIFSFQEEDEIKSRNKHTHHSIDATVLTLIPTNSSHRDRLLKQMYEIYEKEKKQFTTSPFPGFNSQQLINEIESTTLIVNYEKDKILKQTFRNVRKRGRLQYLRGKDGKLVADENGERISLLTAGDTVRSTLYKQSYIGKIRDVEKDSNDKPLRNSEGDWKYKSGKDEFLFTERVPIQDALSDIDAIIDPVIREHIRNQRNNFEIRDFQGNIISHVRIKTKAGQVVKERLNYRSSLEYKNYYYSAAGSVPYAILLLNSSNGGFQREMIPLPSFEIAKMYKETGWFDSALYISKHNPEFMTWQDKKLLKVGQKVLVLNSDSEYEISRNRDFQVNRMYVITQFSEGSIWLKYHLEAQADSNIDESVKKEKDKFLRFHEIQHGISEVVEDVSIKDNKARKEDYNKKKYSFAQLNSFRFRLLAEKMGMDKVKEIKRQLDKFKKQSSFIEAEGNTPLLKMSKENWNFLFEGYDFEISLLGNIKWNKEYDRLGNILPEKKKNYDEPPAQQNILSEPEAPYKSKSLSSFTSFEDMENDQLNYFASLQPEQLLQNLKQMVLAAFGFKEEPSLNSLPHIINFNSEP